MSKLPLHAVAETKLKLVQRFVKISTLIFVQSATLSTLVSKNQQRLADVLTSSEKDLRLALLRSSILRLTQVSSNRPKKAPVSAFFVAMYLLLVLPAWAETTNCQNFSQLQSGRLKQDKVKWVVDGDTIHTIGGKKLRLLHINSPELNPTSEKPAEYFATQSRQALLKLTPKGSTIFWVNDHESHDKYGRELALILDTRNRLVNLEMVKQGAASVLVVPPNQKLWRCFKAAQIGAEKRKLGIWGNTSNLAIAAKQLTTNHRFSWVSGKVTQRQLTRKYLWLVLDHNLWVGIKRKNFEEFAPRDLKITEGDTIKVGGYVFHSHGKLRMNLRHPAMLIN